MSNTCPITADIDAKTAARRLCNRDLAQFHFYNPNGVLAHWSKLSDRLIAFGRGYAAYGDTGFYYQHLFKLARAQRVGKFDLQATISGIERTIAKGEAFLAEQGA